MSAIFRMASLLKYAKLGRVEKFVVLFSRGEPRECPGFAV